MGKLFFFPQQLFLRDNLQEQNDKEGPAVSYYLYPGHGDGGRSGFGHVAVGRASLHQVPGVGHVQAAAGSEHKVLSQGIHQHNDHSFEKRLGQSSGVGSATCNIEARRGVFFPFLIYI